jgi:hypothetical protein
MIRRSVPNQYHNFTISLEQSLLGDKLQNCHPRTLERWWQHLRVAACWMLWKARNTMSCEEIETSHIALLQMIWYRLKMYMQDAWDKLLLLHKQHKLTLEDAKQTFGRDFGYDDTLFKFSGSTLTLPLMAPSQRTSK